MKTFTWDPMQNNNEPEPLEILQRALKFDLFGMLYPNIRPKINKLKKFY